MGDNSMILCLGRSVQSANFNVINPREWEKKEKHRGKQRPGETRQNHVETTSADLEVSSCGQSVIEEEADRVENKQRIEAICPSQGESSGRDDMHNPQTMADKHHIHRPLGSTWPDSFQCRLHGETHRQEGPFCPTSPL